MTEGSEAGCIALRVAGVERGNVGHQDEEVGACGPGAGVGHGNRTGHIVESRLGRGLVGDRRVELASVGADATLDQFARLAVHRPVESLPIEAMRVHIVEEVGGGHRRVGPVERDDDAAEAGLDRDRDEVFLRGLGGRRCGLRKDWSGEGREQRGSKDSVLHGPGISKGRMNGASTLRDRAFPRAGNLL